MKPLSSQTPSLSGDKALFSTQIAPQTTPQALGPLPKNIASNAPVAQIATTQGMLGDISHLLNQNASPSKQALASTPSSPQWTVQDTGVSFSGVPQDTGVSFSGVPQDTGASFSGIPQDTGASFSGVPQDTGVSFSGIPQDTGASFSGIPQDTGASFSGIPQDTGASFSGVPQDTGASFSGVPQDTGASFSGIPQDTASSSSGIPQDTTSSSSAPVQETPSSPSEPAVAESQPEQSSSNLASLTTEQLADLGANDKAGFFAALLPAAKEAERKYGVPAEVTLAQAALESGWGQHSIGGYNIFGIKGSGPAGTVSKQTQEWDGSQYITITANFARYNNFYEAIVEHGKLFHNGYYDTAVNQYAQDHNYENFIDNIQGIYATSPTYSNNLNSIINQYNLA